MKVIIGGLIYLVRFTHVQTGGEILKNGESTPLVRHTECKILQELEEGEQPGFISIGYARCHPKDNFSKELGRQYSLKKALEDGDFTKESRAIFWEEYRNWGKSRF